MTISLPDADVVVIEAPDGRENNVSTAKSTKSPSKPAIIPKRVSLDPFYFWVSRCLFKGRGETLANEDLPPLPLHDRVEALQEVIKRSKTKSIIRFVMNTEGTRFAFAAFMQLIMAFTQILQPATIVIFVGVVECAKTGEKDMLTLFSLTEEQCSGVDRRLLLYLACAAPACSAIAALANHMAQMFTFNIGQRVRSMLITMIFNKILVLRGVPETGEALNLVSNDAQRWIESVPLLNQSWSAVLQICVSVYFIFHLVGAAAFFTISIISLVIPLSALLAKKGEKIRKQHLACADERMRLCAEVIYGARVIKYFVWEKAYTERIAALRKKELREAYKQTCIFGLTMVFTVMAPVLSVVCTIVFYVTQGNSLTSFRAIGVMTFSVMIRFPIMHLGHIISGVAALRVSISRSEKFLTRSEQVDVITSDTAIVYLKDAVFTWNTEFATTPISLNLASGKVCSILGPVGSGKTTLLRGVLGDATLASGECKLVPKCNIAYVPQNPWIFNASLRDNIVFERPFDKDKFTSVMHAACLWEDCETLVDGELTEIGERGVTLSGGQKMRVSIARALYGESDLLIMDDIYAALDAETGHALHANIVKHVEDSKATVIFATNNTAFAENSDVVLTFDRTGRVSQKAKLERRHSSDSTEENFVSQSRRSLSNEESDQTDSTESNIVKNAYTTELQEKKSDKLTTAEELASGTSFSKYAVRRYISSFGWPWFALIFAASSIERVFVVGCDVWLAEWSNKWNTAFDSGWYLRMYVVLLFIALSITVFTRLLFPFISTWAARALFDNMLQGVLRSPMAWFDTTPMGRVLNRMSFDAENLDVTLITKLFPALVSLSWIAGAILVLLVELFPWFFIFLPVGAGVYVFLFQFSRRSIRDIQRLDNINRSPIASLLCEALDGILSIRAYKAGERYSNRLAQYVDQSSRSILTFVAANRWLGVRLELLGSAISLFTGLTLYFLEAPAGDSGLALLWAMLLTISFNFNCVFWALAEASFTSVERVAKYGDLPHEGEHSMFDPHVQRVDDSRFAEASGLKVENVDFRYRPNLPMVLSKLSFTIAPGKRCAVVGRTGAGKSSIGVALFRLVSAESGTISLNGVNLLDIPVDQARLRLGIITQDPVVFTASVRYNLDPFDEYPDEALWGALEVAQLTSVFSSLGAKITQQGANLSVGERQLLCLARTVLRRPILLVSDEATASCDDETDQRIQKALRTWASSSGSSLLTIAHRLETVADHDQLLVMDEGRVIESGTVLSLLEKPNGCFARLVHSAGPETERTVRRRALATINDACAHINLE